MIIDRHAIGDVIKVHALRGTQALEADVTVANRTDDPSRFSRWSRRNRISCPGWGFWGSILTIPFST